MTTWNKEAFSFAWFSKKKCIFADIDIDYMNSMLEMKKKTKKMVQRC